VDHRNAATDPTADSVRDFDYGLGDDLRNAVRQAKTEIAAQIRRAARADVDVPGVRRAYEAAARIAESLSDDCC
jgi:hypothetical protein